LDENWFTTWKILGKWRLGRLTICFWHGLLDCNMIGKQNVRLFLMIGKCITVPGRKWESTLCNLSRRSNFRRRGDLWCACAGNGRIMQHKYKDGCEAERRLGRGHLVLKDGDTQIFPALVVDCSSTVYPLMQRILSKHVSSQTTCCRGELH
jgi:hypothetical protein